MKRVLTAVLLLVLMSASCSLAGSPGEAVNNLLGLRIPASLDIGGEPIPLGREDVSERLEYELLIILGNPVQTTFWLKRMPRFIPEVEKELAERGLPDDLKYVPFIESSLRADSVSPAGAVGPWQFMAQTARDYRLERTPWRDQRRDWKLSTRAALDFLKELHQRFGNWALALAAYNCGPTRLRQAMEWQKHTEFFDLQLPDETERYVFRFLATKVLVTNAANLGIDLSKATLYSKLPVVPYELEIRRNKISLLALSKAAGMSYRYFLEMNPSLTGSDLPKGTHIVNVPEDRVEQFAKVTDALRNLPPQSQAAPKEVRNIKVKAAPPSPLPPPVLAADPAPLKAAAPPEAEKTAPAEAPSETVNPSPPEVKPLASDVAPVLDAPAPTPTPENVPLTATPEPPQKPVMPTPDPAAAALKAASEAIATEPPPQAGKDGIISYIVKKGDTLSGIARQFAVTVDRLQVENGLSSSSVLKPGQQLNVPK